MKRRIGVSVHMAVETSQIRHRRLLKAIRRGAIRSGSRQELPRRKSLQRWRSDQLYVRHTICFVHLLRSIECSLQYANSITISNWIESMYIGGGILGTILVVLLILFVLKRL